MEEQKNIIDQAAEYEKLVIVHIMLIFTKQLELVKVTRTKFNGLNIQCVIHMISIYT